MSRLAFPFPLTQEAEEGQWSRARRGAARGCPVAVAATVANNKCGEKNAEQMSKCRRATVMQHLQHHPFPVKMLIWSEASNAYFERIRSARLPNYTTKKTSKEAKRERKSDFAFRIKLIMQQKMRWMESTRDPAATRQTKLKNKTCVRYLRFFQVDDTVCSRHPIINCNNCQRY